MITGKGLLFKSLVRPFYQANAGFFLVTVFLAFGFLKTPQHVDIATALAHHPVYYLIVLVPWVLYALKTLQFCQAQKRLPAYQFLGYLQLLPGAKRLRQVMLVQAGLLAPTLAYSVLLAAVAFQEQQWLSLAYVFLGNLLIWLVASFRLDQLITQAVDPRGVSAWAQWTRLLPKTLPMLFVHHLCNRQAVLLLGTKLISLALVTGFIMIYEMEGKDLRLISLGLLLSAGVNSALAFHHRQFEQQELRFFRNLPLSADIRFFKVLLTFLIISLPEILVLYLNGVLSVPLLFLLENMMLPVSLLAFFHAMCYVRPINMEQFTKLPFFTVTILFFIILGQVGIGYISGALLLLSWLLFRLYFKDFELAQGE